MIGSNEVSHHKTRRRFRSHRSCDRSPCNESLVRLIGLECSCTNQFKRRLCHLLKARGFGLGMREATLVCLMGLGG